MNLTIFCRYCSLFICFTTLVCAALPPWTSALALAQSCTGKLQVDDDTLSLAPAAASKSPWCTASIGENVNSTLAKAVLRKCPIGSTCRIAGEFSGHGVFFWTNVKSISLMKLELPSVDELAAHCSATSPKPDGAATCLQQLDAAYGLYLTETYQRLRGRLDVNRRKALLDDQTKWLAEQSTNCSVLEGNAKATCLVRTTLERIAALNSRR